MKESSKSYSVTRYTLDYIDFSKVFVIALRFRVFITL